jgi:Domain of unknown function (DUF4136)
VQCSRTQFFLEVTAMMPTKPDKRSRPLVLFAAWFLITALAAAAVKTKIDHDKSVDFSKLRTWAWNDLGAGDVKMARTADDDPEVVRQRAEPVIMEAVGAELGRRGLRPARGSPPDLEVTYYLLITLGSSAQYIGQFVPSVPEWGLPPLTGATQSIRFVEQGSIVLDLSSNNTVMWRGIAQAEIKPGQDQPKRQALIREAVKELLKHYPPRR